MTTTLVILVGVLALLTFGAYVALSPWWTTRAGRASFALFLSLVIVCVHFTLEAAHGPAPDWVENSVIGLVGVALLFNFLTITYKQWHFRGKDKP